MKMMIYTCLLYCSSVVMLQMTLLTILLVVRFNLMENQVTN